MPNKSINKDMSFINKNWNAYNKVTGLTKIIFRNTFKKQQELNGSIVRILNEMVALIEKTEQHMKIYQNITKIIRNNLKDKK